MLLQRVKVMLSRFEEEVPNNVKNAGNFMFEQLWSKRAERPALLLFTISQQTSILIFY
jgi:hypothetical protein